MVEVSNNFKQECEANVGAYKFGKIKVNYIDDNPLNYEQGAYSSSSGAKTEDNQSMRSVNLVECKPSFKYKIELGNSAYKMKIITYTEAQAFIATHDNLIDGNEVTTEATAKYLSVTIYSTDILEGTSILLNGTSRSGALTGAELEGNTSQNGTPTPTSPIEVKNVTGEQVVRVCGKNLFDNILTSRTINGLTIQVAEDKTITINGTISATTTLDLTDAFTLPSGTYIFSTSKSGTINNSCYLIAINTSTNAEIFSLNLYIASQKTLTLNEDTEVKFRLYSSTDRTFTNLKISPMLAKGITASTYEKYQGKDYEINLGNIELNKLGNYQDYIRKGTGKNLIDLDKFEKGRINNTTGQIEYASNVTSMVVSGQTITFEVSQAWNSGIASDFISVEQGDYTLSYYHDREISIYVDTYDENKNKISRPVAYTRNEAFSTKTFTIDNNSIKYIRVHFEVNTATTYNVTDLMLEKGTTATYYEPYGYKDKWYIEKNVGKVVLNGTENWLLNSNYTNNVFYITIDNINKTSNVKTILSNYYNGVKNQGLADFGNNYNYSICSRGYNDAYYHLYISNDSISSVADFKTWLQTNNTRVYYAFANPTYTLIEDENLLNQLEVASHAQTQEGITNILVSGNLPATLEIERDLTDSIKGRQLKPFIGYSITGDDDLISFKITSKADSSKSFIGSCVTKQIDLEIFNAENKHSLENKQIIVSTGMAETTGNFVTFEPFTITGTKDNKTKDKISYVGYDDMYKLNTAYVDTNTYGEDGITLYSFLESLASNANTSLGNESIPNGDFIVDGNPFTNNETNMFALSQVAKLSGGFAEIGRDNKIYIKTLDQDTPTMTLDTNLYSEDFEKAENFGAVNKVVVGESNISGNEAILSDLEDIEINGEHVVEILDSYFLSDDVDKQIICAELFDNLKGLYYLPFSATCNGFPYLDLGDMIEIEDKNGDTYLTYLLNYELSYNGGYKEKIGAEAQSSTETKYKNVNTIKDKFKQVEIIVDKANAQIQSIIQTSGNNYSAINQTIGNISTEVQTATTTAGNAMTAVGALAQGTQQQFKDLTEALSRLSQSVNNIQALFRVTGGANLIQNSVGFFQNSSGAPTMWNVSQGIAGFKHGYDSELLGQTTSQGKFYIRNGTISTTEDDATLETEANISGIEIGSLVTLSFKYKQSADSTTTITLTNGETTFFTATFSEEVEDWTSYSDADNTNSFTCTTDSLVLTITNTSTYNTDDQGFMISDLILNYGEEKTWELHSGESYGGVIQLSSQGISVKSSSANTITYMTSDGIEVFETTQGDVLGDLITKLTSNGIETKDFVATGDITTRNLITTMIQDTSNNDIYIEYIKDE